MEFISKKFRPLNTLTLNVVNNGTDNAKNVSVKVLSENNEIASFIIDNFVVGNDNIFKIVDTAIRPIDENTVYGAENPLANYTVIVGNSTFEFSFHVRYNGNLGKDYAYPNVYSTEITREYEISGDVIIINSPDSSYMSSSTTSRNETFNIEDNSTIVKALLYVPYNWDNIANGDYLRWNVTVNNNIVVPMAHYRDQGNLGNYGNRGYGLVVYDVTGFVNLGENEVILNKESGGCAVYPSSLVVLTNNTSSNKVNRVYIAENADLLSKTYSKSLTVGANTIFRGINTTGSDKSTLYVFAASAQDGEGNIIFNNVANFNVWNGTSNSISLYTLDTSNIIGENNDLFFESIGATILALHQILVVENSIHKEDLNITTSCEPIYEGENATIIVDLAEDATGIVTATVNGTNYTSPIEDGKAMIIIYDLAVGNYTVSVTYSGDDKYNGAEDIVNVNVNPKVVPKKSLNVSVSADAIVAGEDAIIKVSGLDDATGNITAIVNGEEYSAVIENSSVSIAVPGLTENTTVVIIYAGDDEYNNFTEIINITVNPKSKMDSSVNVSAYDITEGMAENILISLPGDATGNVTVILNNKSKVIMINDSTVRGINGILLMLVSYDTLTMGNYTVVAVYNGNDKYNPSNVTASFAVSKAPKENVSMNVSADNVTEGENLIIAVNLPMDAVGNVTASVDGVDYVSPVVNGVAIITVDDLAEGNYTIDINYSGDDKYNSVYEEVKVTVDENKSLIISAPDVTKYYKGSERFTVTVTDYRGNPLDNKSVRLNINGVSYTRTINANGTATFPLGINSGVYNVTASVDNETVNAVVTILPTVNGSDVVKVFRNATQYYATFRDSEGNYLKEGTIVKFNINGVMYERKISGSEGLAKLNLNLGQGSYVITAMNPETGENAANNITIIARLIENKDITKYYRNATQYTVKVIGDDGKAVGAGESVTFNINGVMYTRTTNASGIAKLNLNLQPGNYIITAEYKNCKVSNNIKILPVLSARDISMKYRDGTKFVATLVDGQGKPYAGQTIQFNINGVFYNRITDSSGQAKLNINLMAGEYIITSSYNEANIANSVKVFS